MAAPSHSSWTSNLRPAQLTEELEALRRRGWRGGWIRPHRAFDRLRLRTRDVVASVLLAVGLSAVWLAAMNSVGRLWIAIFNFWTIRMGWHYAVWVYPAHWAGLHFVLPYLNLTAPAPDARYWWTTAAVTVALWIATMWMSEEAVPWKYLLRAVLLIQGTGLAYFAFAGALFPHDLASYTVSMFVFGNVLIAMVPLIFAFTYYLFDFSLLQKLGLTAVTMVHLMLFLPLQYLVHAYILHFSILFMPVLYFGFGPFLDVLVLISFYSWGMSWRSRQDRGIAD